MKNLFTIALFCILSIALSCNSNKENKKDDNKEPVTVNDNTVSEISSNSVQTQIIDSTYLIRNYNDEKGWIELKYRPDDEAPKGNLFPKGQTLYITGANEEWLTVRALITYDESGKYINNPKEGNLYIRKKLTGPFSELHVSESDLNLFSVWNGENNSEERVSDDTLSFKLISKELYFQKKKTSSDYILRDTLDIVKKNGVITLPCKDQTVKYTDADTDNDSRAVYTYIGQMPDFNAYLIYGSYFESFGYFLVDKTSGEITNHFGDFPALSPDKKYIVWMWGNLYEDITEFSLIDVSQSKKECPTLCAYYFTKWLPLHSAYGYETDYFWGNDGYLYVRIQTWELSGQTLKDESRQYMQVKVLNAPRI